MSVTQTITLKCDLQECGKEFIVAPEDKATPGIEQTCGMTIAEGNRELHFCNVEHLLKFAVAWIKADMPVTSFTHAAKVQKPRTLDGLENLNVQ